MRKHSTRMWMGVFMLALPLAARPEGKCGDDPVPGGPNGELTVTWLMPYPAMGNTRFHGPDIFALLDKKMGQAFPPDYPGPKNPPPVKLFYPDVKLSTVQEVIDWEKEQGIEIPPDAVKLLDAYVKSNHVFRGGLVEHPRVSQPKGFSICTCVLQRGIVIYERGSEDLWVRSIFRTRKTNTTRAFVPKEEWKITFTSDVIWFPLAFNTVQKEDSWLVLDILSPTEFRSGAAWPYKVAVPQKKIDLDGKTYYAVRLHARFRARTAVSDLRIDPATVLKP